jgi:hypothetical protein
MAQQLCGSASAWWANYTATLRDGPQVPWAEFCQAFHGHHIPAGMMAQKLQEFLQQGWGVSMSMSSGLITYRSMAPTTLTSMRRRCHYFIRGSTLCFMST